MSNLEQLHCNTCESVLKKLESGRLKCVYCGNEYDYPEKDEVPVEFVNQLNEANGRRIHGHFDEALERYDDIIGSYPDEIFPYWGAFLSDYGIEYVEENGSFHPICHRVSRQSAKNSRYISKMFALCSPSERESYMRRVDEVERIRSQTYEISRGQEPYDVYICGGASENERETAAKLFEKLSSCGNRVFMADRLEKGAHINREAYIFPAIESSSYMFVIADGIDSLASSENVWKRFIALEGKKLQVLHRGLDEDNFPAPLRRRFRSYEPIDTSRSDWLDRAVSFAAKETAEAETAAASSAPAIDRAAIADLISKMAVPGSSLYAANNLAEAFAMALSCMSAGNAYEAERVVNEQIARFEPGEIKPVADLCLELTKLPKVTVGERAGILANINNIAGRIRNYYPAITLSERSVYGAVSNAKLLVYLAKCFGAIKDYRRQCFVLDLVNYGELYDTRVINDLVAMLFINGRSDDVRELLRSVPQMDGDYVLMSYLKSYKDSATKQSVLLGIGNKLVCTDEIEEKLNDWLSSCEDIGIALAVVPIMTRNKLGLDVSGLSGALGRVTDVAGLRTILANIGKRPLDGIAVDKLISMAANGGAEVANEVLRHLRYETGLAEIGAHNMRMLIKKCDLSEIKLRLFDFNVDKKLAEQLLYDALKGDGADRLSTVAILAERVPVVEITAYERLLLGNNPLKEEFMKILAPKTAKVSAYSRTIESYLSGRDDERLKRGIFEMYGDFPFSNRALELYLGIMPDAYDETYIKHLKTYLGNNPSSARELFVRHYEALISGYESVLPLILDYAQYVPTDMIVRFVCDFKGEQGIKDSLFMRLLPQIDKPKNVETSTRGAECNLLQAYLLNLRSPSPSTADVVTALRKKGVKAEDKVAAFGKKMKFNDFLASGDVPEAAKREAVKYLK